MTESVTIITAVRNCVDETKRFLESLFTHKPKFCVEMVMIDDGSEKETEHFLKSLTGGIRVLRNEKSIGFGLANNHGVKHAQSDWILFMNNDLVLSEGWAKPFEQVVSGREKLD